MTSGGNDLSGSNGMSRALKTLDKYRNINLDNYGDEGEVQENGGNDWIGKSSKMTGKNYVFPSQKNVDLNMRAQELGIRGLSNPTRWACCFMSSVKLAADKAGAQPTNAEILDIAVNAYNVDAPNFDNRVVLGNSYNVGDTYELMNMALESFDSSTRVLAAKSSNADFSINIYNTSLGQHYTAANKKGVTFYNPDQSIKTTFYSTMYFRWKE